MVIDAAGKLDALNELEDEPFAGEKVYAYVIMGVDGRDPKTGKRVGRQEMSAAYEFVKSQPCEHALMNKDAWEAWCRGAINAPEHKHLYPLAGYGKAK